MFRIRLFLSHPDRLFLVRIRNTDACIIIVQLLVEKKAELLTEFYDPSSLLCSDEVRNYGTGINYFYHFLIFGSVVGPDSLNPDPWIQHFK